MLTVGIAIMVLSVLAGVGALTFLALKSSSARSAGRRVSTTLVPPGQQQEAPYHAAAQGVRHGQPAGQNAPTRAAEAEEPPPWVLTVSIGSVVGLVLGLLLVMIGSLL